jgi:hypothetical protein
MQRLKSHMALCASCQQRYNKIVLAGRLLEGGPEALTIPSEGELARVREEVLGRVRLVPDATLERRSLVRWVGALAAVGVVLAIALPLTLRHGAAPPARGSRGTRAEVGEKALGAQEHLPELQARGPALSDGERPSRVGVRAFCVRQKAGGSSGIVGLSPAGETRSAGTCGTGDVMKFAYTNGGPCRHLFLFGVDEKMEIKWYEPHPPQTSSVAVRGKAVDEPLPRAVRLSVNHTPGDLRVFAVFSMRPITTAEVQQAVARARADKTPWSALQTLPLEGTEQRSMLLRLAP